MGKTRDLFKKIGDIRELFHARMGTIKDRNCEDLTEAEEIKKRWQEQAEDLYKKGLTDSDKHDGMATHLEPDILEWEVKQALGSITTIKASEGDGIPAELFKIQKDDVVKVMYSICQQTWKTQQWPQDWKMSVFILIPKKGNAKKCSNCHKNTLIQPARLCSKSFKLSFSSMRTENFQIYKPNLEKTEEPKSKLSVFTGLQRK